MKKIFKSSGIAVGVIAGLYGIGRLTSLIPQVNPASYIEANTIQFTWGYIWLGAVVLMCLFLLIMVVGLIASSVENKGIRNEQRNRTEQ